MNTYTFRYRKEIHVNQFGTERVNGHFIDGVRYKFVDNNIFQRAIKNYQKNNNITYTQFKTIESEHGNLSRNIDIDKFYISNEIILTIRTNKKLEDILFNKSTLQYPEFK